MSQTSLAEQAMVDYTGFKYAVGFNSCGSSLFVALKCVGVEPAEPVLCNAFSFSAVPSAVHHAAAVPTYVECTEELVLDTEDLAAKITSETRCLLLTHMRGKVADMERVYEIADARGLRVVEDCAHALGVRWDGQQLGRRAAVACFSSQSAKVLNSGEGGFLCTDDEEVAARAICYAGCYEGLIAQHAEGCRPSREAFDRVKKSIPNYSLRMSDLTASCIAPQIRTLEERVATYNRRYADLVRQLSDCEHLHVPPIDARVRPVCDSLQLLLRGMRPAQIRDFLAASARRGLPVGLFGSADNARNLRNWQFSPPAVGVDSTEAMIAATIDVRLPLAFADDDITQMGAVLLAAVDDVMGEQVEGKVVPSSK